jgi:hypothetical protein
MASPFELGPCCMCGGPDAINIITLDRRSAIPGHGWGCYVCGLPPDGASAVVCTPCLELYQEKQDLLQFCCRGYPATEGRIPIADLPEGKFAHDEARHALEDAGRAPAAGRMQ